jgi:hypothetical protein
MSRLKFIATLNVALHPATGDGEILAAVRGAYRLLGGKSVDEFLEQTQQSPPSESGLAIRLNAAEQKLESAVSYCNELKSQIINLQRELFQATASRDRVTSARAFKRRFAFIGRHPVMSFFAASIAIGVIASQGKDQVISSSQNSSSPVSPTESHSSDTSLQRCSVVGGWKIEYNPHSEVSYMTKVYSSNTELIIGYNGVRYVMLLKL